MIPNVPEVSVFAIPLDVAGETILRQRVGYIHLWQFENSADGSLSLDGMVEVVFGAESATADALPMGYNSRMQIPPVDSCTIRWASQPGRRARFLVGPDARQMEANNIPARQLVTGTGSTVLAAGTTTVGLTAITVGAQAPTRSRITFQSDFANTGLIGLSQSAGITLATAGVILRPGDAFTMSSQSIVRAISDTAGQLLRRMEELA